MKKGIVRVLCGILAAQLILPQGVYSVKAEEVTDQAAEMTVESPEDTQTEDLQQEKVSQSTLSVTMHHASVLERKQNFRVSLEGTSFEKAHTHCGLRLRDLPPMSRRSWPRDTVTVFRLRQEIPEMLMPAGCRTGIWTRMAQWMRMMLWLLLTLWRRKRRMRFMM